MPQRLRPTRQVALPLIVDRGVGAPTLHGEAAADPWHGHRATEANERERTFRHSTKIEASPAPLGAKPRDHSSHDLLTVPYDEEIAIVGKRFVADKVNPGAAERPRATRGDRQGRDAGNAPPVFDDENRETMLVAEVPPPQPHPVPGEEGIIAIALDVRAPPLALEASQALTGFDHPQAHKVWLRAPRIFSRDPAVTA